MMLELSMLLTLFGGTEQSASELAGAALVWLCGQWAFLVLACMALLSLVLLLCLKESFRTPREYTYKQVYICEQCVLDTCIKYCRWHRENGE